MDKLFSKTGPIVFLAALLLCDGCASPQVRQEIELTQHEAADEWQSERDAMFENGPVLEGELALDQALALALKHNRTLQNAFEAKNIASGRIMEAYQGVLPNVNLSGTYTRIDTDHRVYETTPGTYAYQSLGDKNSRDWSLSVTQTLFSGGSGLAAMRAARYYDDLTDQQSRLVLQQVVAQTVQAYYQVLLAQEQVKVTQVYADLAKAHLGDVRVKRRYGTASDFNVLRSEVEDSKAASDLIRYRNSLHTAQANLFKTIGVSQGSRVKLSGVLAYEPLSVEERDVIRTAFANRPDLMVADLQEKMQGEAVKVAYSAYTPKVNAFFDRNYGRPDPYLSYNNQWEYSWDAGVKVTVPIFDGLGREGRLKQEKAALRQYQINTLDAREQALFEVRNAVANLEDAAELVDAQKLSVDQAAEGLRIAEVGYREGTLDQVSLLDAQAALTEARLTYYQSLYEHSIARINLEQAQGTLAAAQTNEEAK